MHLTVKLVDAYAYIIYGFIPGDSNGLFRNFRLPDLLLAIEAVEQVPGKSHPDKCARYQVFLDAVRIERLLAHQRNRGHIPGPADPKLVIGDIVLQFKLIDHIVVVADLSFEVGHRRATYR